MTREIVLDTETTGLDPEDGHKIVEIGCIELINHLPSGRSFHKYINPERDMPTSAYEVHGLSDDFLKDKPVFKDIVQEFITFIGQAKLVIHNAAFDMKFLNAELKSAGETALPHHQAIDTLDIARKKYPGAQNSLDALCRRFGVDNSGREKHGALLDSELLAEVYLELIGGRQPDFQLIQNRGEGPVSVVADLNWEAPKRPNPLPSRLTDTEKAAHEAFIAAFPEKTLWKN